MSDAHAAVGFREAMQVVDAVVRRYVDKDSGAIPEFVVLIGGTALAARGIREFSHDVDMYLRDVDDDVFGDVQEALRGRYGGRFKIDATSAKNLWGAFVVDDIERSETVAEIDVDGRLVEIRALDLETLYVIKAAANRPKDVRDLSLISDGTDVRAVLARINVMMTWYSDRSTLPAFLDRFSRYVARDYGLPIEDVDALLECPSVVRDGMLAYRKAQEQQLVGVARRVILSSVRLIEPDEADPSRMTFDFAGAGVPPEARSALLSNPSVLADIVMEALGRHDPKRMLAWRMASRGKEPTVVDKAHRDSSPEEDARPTPR